MQVVVLITAIGCSAPALPADLADAERYVRRGQYDLALASYLAAQQSCRNIKSRRQRRSTCSSAHLGHAELLVDQGKRREAAELYESLPPILADDPPAAAQATYRAGQLFLAVGDDERAYTLLWKTVTDFPAEAFAADALRIVLRDGRQRDPRQLFEVLGKLAVAMRETQVADNILYALADLAENEFRDQAAARAFYDQLATDYPQSGLVDESLWHGARLARLTGDPKGAAVRLRRLLATREVAYGAGSYFSVWLDNAQLELGRVLRDDLGDYQAALAAFRRLPRDYPASVLRDDAMFERAVTWNAIGRRDRACNALSTLQNKWPDSKYELEKAPALRRELGCLAPE